MACGPATTLTEEPSNTPPHSHTSSEASDAQTTPKQSTDPNDGETPTRSARPSLPPPVACGEFDCFAFSTAGDAVLALVLEKKARLIAFGEAHTPAGFQGASTVTRFTSSVLPSLAPESSHLLVELLSPPASGCQKEKAVAEKESKEITQGQAESNQNEYLSLGNRAREMGLVPDILRATCEHMQAIAAPDGGVLKMMETIADLSAEALTADLKKTKPGRPLVLAYGGALHNDAHPRPGFEGWSYAPRMLEVTDGAYLEIDLIVPELVKDTESWRKFVWYEAFQALDLPSPVLLKWGPQSYALFFARS